MCSCETYPRLATGRKPHKEHPFSLAPVVYESTCRAKRRRKVPQRKTDWRGSTIARPPWRVVRGVRTEPLAACSITTQVAVSENPCNAYGPVTKQRLVQYGRRMAEGP